MVVFSKLLERSKHCACNVNFALDARLTICLVLFAAAELDSLQVDIDYIIDENEKTKTDLG